MHLSLKGSLDRQPLTDRLGDRLLAEYGGAAAAYSLRALNGNGDSVVRVRRASDNDEKDFTALQVSSGELTNWVNSQIVPPLDIGVETSEGRIPVPEGGTSIGIPAAAYSLRNLSTTYTGNVVDVRRSSDDAEDSFTAAEVADGTLEAWVSEDTTQYMQFDGVDDFVNFGLGDAFGLHGASKVEWRGYIYYDGSTPTGSYSIVTQFIRSTSAGFYLHISAANTLSAAGRSQTGDSFQSHAVTISSGWIYVKAYLDFANDEIGISLDNGAYNTSAATFGSSTYTQGDLDIFNARFGDAESTANAEFKGIIGECELLIDDVQTEYWPATGNTDADWVSTGSANGTVNGSPTSTLLNDGFVTKWYDQSGNDNHATQGTAASQPKIVDGGSLVSGGIDFDGVDDFLNFSAGRPITSIDAVSGFFVGRSNTSSNQCGVNLSSATGSKRFYLPVLHSGQFRFGYAGEISAVNLASPDTSEHIFTGIAGTSTASGYYDGEIKGTVTSATGVSGVSGIGSISNSYNWDGEMREIIIYDSDQSANRTAIEANIGETYGITGIPAYDNTVDGFVETWYDQSGNGNDATQSVAASQPKIVDGGVLVSGGLDFDGVDDLLELSGSGLDIFKDVGYAQVFAVAKSSETGTGGGRLILATTAISTAARYVLSDSPTVSASYRIAGRRLDSNPLQTVTSNSPHGNLEKILTGFLNYNDSEAYLYQNGSLALTALNFQSDGNSSNTSSSLVEFGSNGFDGTIREIIVYPSDQSANRVAIEMNINDHYNIYP